MNDYKDKPVTLAQVRDMLADRPTRWEMRALIVAAVVANQLIPVLGISSPTHSAVGFVARLFS